MQIKNLHITGMDPTTNEQRLRAGISWHEKLNILQKPGLNLLSSFNWTSAVVHSRVAKLLSSSTEEMKP